MERGFWERASSAIQAVRLRPGEPDGWDEFYRLFYPRIHHLFRVLSRPEASIQDLTQEVFLRFLRSSPWAAQGWSTLPEAPVVWGYLKRIARNLWRDCLKSPSSRLESIEEPDEIAQPEEFAFDSEGVKFVVGRLTQGDQELFALRYLEELSMNEIAVVLNSNPSTIATRLSRLRKRMREFAEDM